MKWSKNSWKSYEAKQLHTYTDENKLNSVPIVYLQCHL